MDTTLQHILDRLRDKLEKDGRKISAEPIQYGVKITLYDSGQDAGGNLYHSKKKRRISWVPNGKGANYVAEDLLEALSEYLTEKPEAVKSKNKMKREYISKEEKALSLWIGTDETGKGDLFGPMVVGGFIADPEINEQLAEMGVKDSKRMTSSAILKTAKLIKKTWPEKLSVVAISPERYNDMYPDFKRQGGINGILGWAHAKVIKELMQKDPAVEAAVVDKFGGEHRLKRFLPDDLAPKKIIMRTRGESNLAVAAGAILARERYETALFGMMSEIGFKPHAGSGKPAVNDLHNLAKAKPEELHKYVKTHFAPVQALENY